MNADNHHSKRNAGHDNPEGYMGILDHLEELRNRLIYSVLFLFAGFIAGMFLAKPAIGFLFRPFEQIEYKHEGEPLKFQIGEDDVLRAVNAPENPQEWEKFSPRVVAFYGPEDDLEQEPLHEIGAPLNKPVFFNLLEPIMLWLKASFIIGIILALPFVLHQAWLFVKPGLTPGERRVMARILALAAVLFPTGASFAYLTFKTVVSFLVNFQLANIEPMLNVTDFAKVELKFMFGFGLAFELPIVIMFLTLMGVVTPQKLRQWRPYSFVIMGFLSMLLTPPDPMTMLAMMLPLFVLYEFSIFLSIPVARKRREEEEELEREDDSADKEDRTVEERGTEGEITFAEEPPRAPIGGRGAAEGSSASGSLSEPEEEEDEMYYEDYEDEYEREEAAYERMMRQREMERKRWLRKKMHRKRRRKK